MICADRSKVSHAGCQNWGSQLAPCRSPISAWAADPNGEEHLSWRSTDRRRGISDGVLDESPFSGKRCDTDAIIFDNGKLPSPVRSTLHSCDCGARDV